MIVAHASLTENRIMRAVRKDDMVGFCVTCGKARKETEPDATRYPCARCKTPTVYGAQEIMFRAVAYGPLQMVSDVETSERLEA